ncbi:hypothetical protein GCM10010420_53810 [Streptomyces glaucosporus]|uniref:Uncharacterized protein n=1 Tax=Streptomyces glaucosporus TaxID=284044 RepID=A0ABP5W0S8_9ACTN
MEAVPRATAADDHGPKPEAYAAAGVPACLVVDPYTARCRLCTRPGDGGDGSEPAVGFGEPVRIIGTSAEATIATDGFPRD